MVPAEATMPSPRPMLLPLLLAPFVGCGGAAPPAEAPASQRAETASPPPPPAYGQPQQPGQGPPSSGYGQPAPAPAPPAGGFDDHVRLEREAATAEEAWVQLQTLEAALTGTLAAEMASGRCERACQALASMERSADRLCDLAGGEDDRCTSARERVEASSTRVTDAGCGC